MMTPDIDEHFTTTSAQEQDVLLEVKHLNVDFKEDGEGKNNE